MSTALQVTLILVLVAIAIGLIPLLNQLRRTAKALDAFLLSSQKDLAQIAEDVHAGRLRMDRLANSVQGSLNEFSTLAESAGEVGRSLKQVHARVHSIIEYASRNFGSIVGGLGTVLALYKCRSTPDKPEKEPQP